MSIQEAASIVSSGLAVEDVANMYGGGQSEKKIYSYLTDYSYTRYGREKSKWSDWTDLRPHEYASRNNITIYKTRSKIVSMEED